MATEFYAFEMLTGQRLLPLPVASGNWSIATNVDEKISCAIPATAAVTKALDIWNTTPVARTGLLAVVDDVPVAAGPIWKRKYTQGRMIDLTAGGLRSYWDRRILLPVSARGQTLIDPVTGEPRTEFDTNISGLSYGTIAKRWVELVRAWPGGAIPMVLPADEAAPVGTTRERNVAAIELKRLKAMLDNLTGLENGPDIAFRPRWSADGLGIYWEMQTGTNAKPRLGNDDADLVQWTVGARVGGAFDLVVDEDGTSMADEVFAAGGRQGDRVLIERSYNPILSTAGFPLLQAADSTHSTVTDPATMQGYAKKGTDLGRFAASFWRMKVRAAEPGVPPLGDYWLGDMATINVDPAEPVLGRPSGTYPVRRRIASLAGDERGQAFDIDFAEALA